MKKIIFLILAIMMVFSVTACGTGEGNSAEQTPEIGQTSEVEQTTQIELKPFELRVEDGILSIIYPDGEKDENVDYYEVYINQLSLMDRIYSTEVNLNELKAELVAFEHIFVEVYAVNEERALVISNSVSYDMQKTEEETSEEETTKAVEIPAVPTVSIVTNSDHAVLTIEPVDGAEGYEVYINGTYINSAYELTYTIWANDIAMGLNEVYVRAFNAAGYSEYSKIVTTGKLANPIYHSTGTGVELLHGDVENAQGYLIYGDDSKHLATMELGGTYDFSGLYTKEGFYMGYIQAYAEGWMSSEKCGIPIMIGGNGGPVGD